MSLVLNFLVLICFHPPMVGGYLAMQSHFLKVEYKLPSTTVPIDAAVKLIHTPERLFSGHEFTGMRTHILRSDMPVRTHNHTSVRMCLRVGWHLQDLHMFTGSPYRSNALFSSQVFVVGWCLIADDVLS